MVRKRAEKLSDDKRAYLVHAGRYQRLCSCRTGNY